MAAAERREGEPPRMSRGGSLVRALRALRSRRILRWTSVLLVLLVLGAIVLWQGVGMQLVIPRVLAWAAPEGWTVDVRDVDGAWASRIRLRGLEVSSPQLSATVEELYVDYALLPLFERTIELDAVEIDRPRITVEPADSAAPPDSAQAADTARAPSILTDSPLGDWTVTVHRALVREGALAVEAAEGGGAYRVQDLRMAGSGALQPSGLRLVLDTLGADVEGWAVGAEDVADRPGSGRLAASGSLRDAVLQLDSLVFVTDRSEVRGGGVLALAAARPHFNRVDFELAAHPLDLRDLPLTLPPPLQEDPRVRLDLVAEGGPDSILVRADVHGPASATADLVAVVRASEDAEAAGDESPAVTAELTVRDVDLGPWSPSPFDGTAEVSAQLALERLDPNSPLEGGGAVIHHAPADTIGGLLGHSLRLRFDVSRHASRDAPTHQASSDHDRVDATTGSATENGEAAPGGEEHVTEVTAVLQRPRSPDQPRIEQWEDVAVLEGRLAGQASDWVLDMGLDGSELEGSGWASWAAEGAMTVAVQRLSVSSFDLQRLLSGLPATSITGRSSGRVTGSGPDDLDGSVQVRLDRSSFTSLTVDSLALTADLAAGTANGRVMVSDSIRRLVASYRAGLEGDLLRAEMPNLRLSSIGVPADSAAIEAAGRASGTWLLSDTLPRSGSLDVELDSAAVSGTRLTGGSVHAELDGERITAEASAVASSLLPGTMRLDADLDARGTEAGGLTGTLDLTVLRSHPSDSVAAADTATAGADGTATVVDTLRATVVATEPGHFRLDGRLLPAQGGRLLLAGQGTVAGDSIALDLQAHGGLPSGTALLDGAGLDTIDLTVTAVRDSAAWERVDARLLSAGGAWREVVMDTLRAHVVAGPDGILLDTLRLDSNVATLWGAGRLPADGAEAPGSIEILGTLDSLEPVESSTDSDVLAADSGSIWIAATGTLDSLDLDASLSLAALATGDLRLDGLRAGVHAVVEPPRGSANGFGSGTAEIALERVFLPTAEIRSVNVTAEGSLDSLRVEADAIVDDTRTGNLTLVVDRRPDARTALIEALDFQLDEDVWQIQEPALVSYADGYSVDSLRLAAGEQSIAIDGGVGADGALELTVDVDSTNIGTVTDLAGFPALQGWIAGRVRLEGTVDAPRGVADLRGDFHRPEQSPASTRIALDADGRRVSADVELEDPEGGVLTVAGSARLPGAPAIDEPTPTGDTLTAEEELDFTVAADSLHLSWVLPFLQPELVQNLGGTLQGEMTVVGSLEEPGLGGAMRVRDASASLPPLGVSWQDIRLYVRGSGSQLVVDSAHVGSGDGDMVATGYVTVADEAFPIDFAVILDDFQAIRNESYWATVSGRLEAGGTVTAPVVEGRIMVESLDVYLDQVLAGGESLQPVELTEEDLRMLEEHFGYVPEPEAEGPPVSEMLTADLTIEFSRDSWLRKQAAPEMAVAFTGQVEAHLRPQEEPVLEGSLEVIENRGYIEQFGKRFELSEGTVTLDGPPSAAQVDLSATYTVPSRGNPDDAEATIVLSVEGSQESLSLTLSSDPPMENADIVSFLATGRPASSALSFGGEGEDEGLVAAGADLALGQIAGALEGAAAQSVGLDVVEIEREGLRQATLVAGKYVTPRLFVGFAQPITLREGNGLSLGEESQPEIEIEVQALRWLLVNIEASGSIFRFFLRGRRAY